MDERNAAAALAFLAILLGLIGIVVTRMLYLSGRGLSIHNATLRATVFVIRFASSIGVYVGVVQTILLIDSQNQRQTEILTIIPILILTQGLWYLVDSSRD